MTNAKEELLEHIKDRSVKCVHVSLINDEDNEIIAIGQLEKIIEKINFDYDNGFGAQMLHGTIWYEDGTWSERQEYDGSEKWVYKKCPKLPTQEII